MRSVDPTPLLAWPARFRTSLAVAIITPRPRARTRTNGPLLAPRSAGVNRSLGSTCAGEGIWPHDRAAGRTHALRTTARVLRRLAGRRGYSYPQGVPRVRSGLGGARSLGAPRLPSG